MIKRRDFLKMTAKAGAVSLIFAGKAVQGRAAEFPGALPAPLPDDLPKSVETNVTAAMPVMRGRLGASLAEAPAQHNRAAKTMVVRFIY